MVKGSTGTATRGIKRRLIAISEKCGHFKGVCRKKLQDQNRQKKNHTNNTTNPNVSYNQSQRNNFGFNNRNNPNNFGNQVNNLQPNNDIQTMMYQTLTSALPNSFSSNA